MPQLQQQTPSLCRLLSSNGLHVGNLKLIGGMWKLKAIGYDTIGQVIPGGGPLTAQHNTTFEILDEGEIRRVLGLLP